MATSRAALLERPAPSGTSDMSTTSREGREARGNMVTNSASTPAT
jgi:hypothetical protein